MTAINGNTYPVKDAIKSLGGRWNPDTKSWMVPDAKADEARKLVAGAPKTAYAGAHRSSRQACDECGRPGATVHCSDSSGLSGICCPRCASGPAYNRSFA